MSKMRLGVRLWRERGTKGVRVPRWVWGQCPPKSDTNPLTLPEHPCYYPHRSNTNLTISRRNQKPREAPETHPRTQRPSPSQRPSRRPAAQATGAISSPHWVPCTFPDPQAMERRPGFYSHPSPYTGSLAAGVIIKEVCSGPCAPDGEPSPNRSAPATNAHCARGRRRLGSSGLRQTENH